MALPVSVGDIVDIAKTVVKIYKLYCEANKHMQRVIDEVKIAQTCFETLKSPMQQPEFLRSPNGKKLNEVFKNQIDLLITTLRELEIFVTDWSNASPNWFTRFMFVTFRIRQVSPLGKDLEVEMKHIRSILEFAKDHGVKIAPEQFKELLEAAKRPVNEPSKTESWKTLQWRSTIAAFNKVGISEAQTPPLDKKWKQSLQENLESIPGLDVKKLVEQYNQAAKAPILDAEILVVDNYNGRRSIMAQTYLELIRVWTANNGQPWLFRRVDSAGIRIKSTLSERKVGILVSGARGLPEYDPGFRVVSADAVDAMAGTLDYFSTDTNPKEKERIIERMKVHKRQGIKARMFLQHRYILTFSNNMRATLEQLCRRAIEANPRAFRGKPLPKLLLLPNTTVEREPPATELVKPIGDAVEAFLATKLAWTRPTKSIPTKSISGRGLRTCLMQVRKTEQVEKVKGNKGENLSKLEKETGCKIYVCYQSKEFGYLVSILGPEKDLGKAETMIRACFEDRKK